MPTKGKGSSIDSLGYLGLVAVILSLTKFFGPNIRAQLRPRAEQAQSFGGGVAIAYIFLTLLPEIDIAHEWLGEHIHLVTLISFLVFYAIELLLIAHIRGTRLGHKLHDHVSTPTTRAFWFHIGIMWVYIWMIVFAMPDDKADSLFFAVFGSLTIALHLVYKDYVLRSHHDAHYQNSGRYLLSIAPIAGLVAHRVFEPTEVVLDVFVAILAGVIPQGVFREELPTVDGVKLPWLFTGAGIFTLLVIVT